MKTVPRRFKSLLFAAMSIIAAAVISLPSHAEHELLLLPDQRTTVDDLEVVGTVTSPVSGFRMMNVPGAGKTYFIFDRVASFEDQVADRLSSIHRYESDISIFFGFIKGEFLHLILSGPNAGEAIYVTGEPWLFMQLQDIAESKPGVRGTGTLKLREFRFPFAECDSLADGADGIVSALRRGAASIGSRPPPKELWVLDGAHYSLNVRLLDTEIAIDVGGNSALLFEPVNSTIQLVRKCVEDGLDFTLRRYDLSTEVITERLVQEDTDDF